MGLCHGAVCADSRLQGLDFSASRSHAACPEPYPVVRAGAGSGGVGDRSKIEFHRVVWDVPSFIDARWVPRW
jgi:hypothetical protein